LSSQDLSNGEGEKLAKTVGILNAAEEKKTIPLKASNDMLNAQL
jgi:hypothetical protein